MMTLVVPTSMITVFLHGYQANYCVECADERTELRQKIEQALKQENLQIDEPAGSERCEACGRLIREVPAYQRLYVLQPRFVMTTTLEIPARSATEVLALLDEAVDADAITQKVEAAVEDQLAEGKLSASELTYTVTDPKIKPPPSSRSLVAIEPEQRPSTRFFQLNDPMALPNVAQVEAATALYHQTQLADKYPGSLAANALLHFFLTEGRIIHTLFQGYLTTTQEERSYPHSWIEVRTQVGPRLVDYSARQWRNDETMPHGVFAAEDYPHLQYQGSNYVPLFYPKPLCQELRQVAAQGLSARRKETKQ